MNTRRNTWPILIVCLSLLLALIPGNPTTTFAQDNQPPQVIRPDEPLPPEVQPWQVTPDGRKYMPSGAQPSSSKNIFAPRSTGGPDEFGYTWNDNMPLAWIDAVAGGTDTGMSGYAYNLAPVQVALPFGFKYYENTYNQVYINAAGFVGFTSSWSNWQNSIPSPTEPNNVIAPYWLQDIYLNNTGPSGRVYYKSGGTAPNRYFVAEWYNVRGGDPSDTIGGDDVFRFEVILYENGTFDFQYQAMTYNGNTYWCYTGAGIEDSTGLDGLTYLDGNYCDWAPSDKAVRFTRPAPSARVAVNPIALGSFGAPNEVVQFNAVIRNAGDIGNDTFDLFTSSGWPMTLYNQNGITPLGDTDTDGAIDTGVMAPGTVKTIVVKVTVPATATLGQSSNGQIIAQSSLNSSKVKTVPVQVAVPAAFAQSYTQNYSPYAGFYRPLGQATQHTTTSSGYDPSVAATPNGNIVQVWYQYRQNNNGKSVGELYYAVLDKAGNIVRPATRIADNSTAMTNVYDSSPAVAVAPNGNIGIVWYRYEYNSSNGTRNYNIYYVILNSAGGWVAVESLTNNALWGSGSMVNVPRFYYPTIAATTNNRFAIAWQQQIYNGSTTLTTNWYTIRDAGGILLKPMTQFGGANSYAPNLLALADGSVFVSEYLGGSMAYGRLDSAGNVLNSPTALGVYGYAGSATQLPNGNIVLAWGNYNIQYVVFDSSLSIVKGVTGFPRASLIGDASPSVTYFGNRAVITWSDECCNYQPNLYYALLDGTGNLLTPPMIFASDNANYSLELPYNGQGNTHLPEANDVTPPISQAYSPAFVTAPFTVAWSGSDTHSGVMNYNVQVRDGAGGTWTTWLANTVNTSAVFATGVAGHTYYFRSLARDWAGNVETGLPANGDTHTTVAAFKVTGNVFNNRHQPIFNASVEANPAVVNIAQSDGQGTYALYLNTTGVYSVTASRYGFGTLPAQRNLSLTGNDDLTNLVLPPVTDAVTNGGWETGDFSGWTLAPGFNATIETTATHTGNFSLQLNNVLPGLKTTRANADFYPVLTQTLTLSGTQPTLSYMYRVVDGSGSLFVANVEGESGVLSQTITLTPGNWAHAWLDLAPLNGQTITLTFGLENLAANGQLDLDEISVGDTKTGAYHIFLPLIRR